MAYKSRVGEILLKAKVLDELQLRSAMAQHEQWGGRLSKVISDMGLADEDTIADTIAKATNVPRMRLGNMTRDAAALSKLDVTFAESKMVFPVQMKDNGKTLVLAMSDPTDLDVVDQVTTRARARVQVTVAGESEIHNAILVYYRNMDPSAVEAPRARRAVQRASEHDSEDEFKITDMSGKTVLKRLADIVDPALAGTDPGLANAMPAPSSSQHTSELLDEILSSGAGALTPEELARLESVRLNQAKSGKIIRAVVELLAEKGYLTAKDFQARVRVKS